MKYENLIKRGNEFLGGTKFPIIGGAMTWVSDAKLVASISNEGCFGVLASGAMSPEHLGQEIELTKKLLLDNKKFGVNLITMHPQLREMIEVCLEKNIEYIVFAGSIALLKKNLIEILKENQVKILTFAPSLSIAKGLIRMGIDALILEGHEAGGHVGPVSTAVLAQEILPYLADQVPIFMAGGIGHGNLIAAFLKMGAAGVQIGTHFVCTHESRAHPNFKKAFIAANSRDAVVSVQLNKDFHVIPVRSIKNKAYDLFNEFQIQTIKEYQQGLYSKDQAQLKIEKFWAGALRKAVIDGDVENGSLMAGQSVGMVNSERSLKDLIDELITQTQCQLNKD